MNAVLPLLAELDENEQLLLKNLGRSGTSQMTIIFGSLAAVFVLSFLFAFVFRKRLLRKRKRHHHHHHHHHHQASNPAVTEEARPKRRRWRRPRREHRPLNPTLAQTRGLPPMRDPDQPPPGL